MLGNLIQDLKKSSSEERAEINKKFFKTGKGEYGEGDVFVGLTMPQQRMLAKKYSNLSLSKIKELLKSKFHEYRSVGLLILVEKYKKSSDSEKENIFSFYLRNTNRINNWDLVDVTCSHIVGDFLLKKERKILYKLASSKNLWERRISIVSTFRFIREGDFIDSLAISENLLKDEHDLIHKAVGWMLREIGKRDEKLLKNFLKGNYDKLPRTTLRYSIERFPKEERKKWILGNI